MLINFMEKVNSHQLTDKYMKASGEITKSKVKEFIVGQMEIDTSASILTIEDKGMVLCIIPLFMHSTKDFGKMVKSTGKEIINQI